MADSAVCANEMPSLALREACDRPLIWRVIRVAMARPAASSLDEFTRRPEERRCMACCNGACVWRKFFCAFRDIIFVLIVKDISILQNTSAQPRLRCHTADISDWTFTASKQRIGAAIGNLRPAKRCRCQQGIKSTAEPLVVRHGIHHEVLVFG